MKQTLNFRITKWGVWYFESYIKFLSFKIVFMYHIARNCRGWLRGHSLSRNSLYPSQFLVILRDNKDLKRSKAATTASNEIFLDNDFRKTWSFSDMSL